MTDPTDRPATLQLRVTLAGMEPAIWRRILVPSTIHLGQLHDVIQCAMGWTDSHLHEFQIGGRRYATPMSGFGDPDDRVIQERNAKVGQLVGRRGERFAYVYDFGDDWRHEIAVEDILPAESGRPAANCAAGEGCCPPEDVGGIFGYAEFLEVIADPSHEDHERWLDWVGGSFDPDAFDLEDVNIRLTNLCRRWRGSRARQGKSALDG